MADAERPPCPLWAKLIATGGGVGFIPFAPGTWGSLAAIGILLVIAWITFCDNCIQYSYGPIYSTAEGWFVSHGPVNFLAPIAMLFFVPCMILGTLASTRYARHTGIRDPKQVVIDELAGQSLTLSGLYNMMNHPVVDLIGPVFIGFIIFRILDIWKPWPIRWFEKLPGGWGIMMDDVVAGIFGAVILAVLVHFHWLPGM